METELQNLRSFSNDNNQDKLVVYEIEFTPLEDPNEKFCAKARAQGDCPCRLWFILFIVNLSIVTIVVFLILLLLLEVGPVPPFQSYGQQCVSAKCDTEKNLVCRTDTKTCRCPTDRWFWYNGTKCRECPPNWIVGNDGTGCFFVSQIQLNFTDANIWCQNSQSRLIEIVETKLFTALQTLKNFRFRLNDFFWIGLREIGPNRYAYRWVTSASIFSSSNFFCSGQPKHNFNYYFQQYDQCVGLDVQTNSSTCFRDSTCPNVARFLCELY